MLTYAMLYTVVVGAPIAFGAWAVAAVLRRYGRPERGVWLGALVVAVAVPATALSRPAAEASFPTESVATGVLGLPDLVVVPEEAAPIGFDAYAIALWALLSGLLLARWAIGAHRLRRASRTWPTDSFDGVEVQVTADVGPAVAGVFRPRILAPAWIATLPDSKRALVLLHEQEHIRAADPLVAALARLVRVVLPWNPVTWLLCSRLVRAVELDCDRRVLRARCDVAAYGSALLDISGRRSSRLAGAAAFAESEAPLRSRILAMTTPPKTVSLAAILASVVLGVVLMVGAFEIPIPSVRFQMEIGRSSVRSEVAAEARAFRPSSSRPRLINEGEVQVVARQELARVLRQDVEAEVEHPSFTPMSVEPMMLNRPQVARALLEAYPPELRDRGVGGTTILQLRVGTEGRVLDRMVQKSSGYAAMDEAALRVVDLMRFEPARNRDQRVPVWVSQRATFVPVSVASDLTDHHAGSAAERGRE